MSERDPEAYDRFERAAELPMLVLSLAFVPIVVLPEVVDLSTTATTSLDIAAWLIWAAFVVEFVVLLYLAPSRPQMMRTHLLDLVIIAVPFLRPLRVARAGRALRGLVGIGRALTAVRRVVARPGFSGFLAVVAVVVAIGGVLVYAAERDQEGSNIASVGDGLWWAVVTSTTVGYGDRFPVSAEGRAIAVVLMMLGIALLSVVTANIAAYFVSREEQTTLDDLAARLDRIEELLTPRDPQG